SRVGRPHRSGRQPEAAAERLARPAHGVLQGQDRQLQDSEAYRDLGGAAEGCHRQDPEARGDRDDGGAVCRRRQEGVSGAMNVKLDTPGPVEQYLRYLEQGRFMLQRSRRSGEVFYYPRAFAAGASSADLEWVEMSGDGTVYSTTTVRRK